MTEKREVLVELVGPRDLVDPYHDFSRDLRTFQDRLERYYGIRGPTVVVSRSDLSRRRIESHDLSADVRIVVSDHLPVAVRRPIGHILVVNIVLKDADNGWNACTTPEDTHLEIRPERVNEAIRSILIDIYIANSYSVSEVIGSRIGTAASGIFREKVTFCVDSGRQSKFGPIARDAGYTSLSSLTGRDDIPPLWQIEGLGPEIESVVMDWDQFVLTRFSDKIPRRNVMSEVLRARCGPAGQISPAEFAKCSLSGALVAVLFQPKVRVARNLSEEAFSAFPENFRALPSRNSVALIHSRDLWRLLPPDRLRNGVRVKEGMNPFPSRKRLLDEGYLRLEKFYVC